MKLGVRAHDYGKKDANELANILHKEGYETVQLVLPKAIAGIKNYDDINLDLIWNIRKIFEQNRLEISVFGCYMNLGNPDDEIRNYAVNTLKQCLFWAKELGAGVIGTETSYSHLNKDEKKIWKPYMLDSLKQIMAEAQRIDMKLAIEPVHWHPLADMETVREVVDEIHDPSHLRIIFDASNLLEYPHTTDQNLCWKSWLYVFGEYIDVLHIKDFTVNEKNEYLRQPLGKGIMNYQAIGEWIHQQKREVSLIREEMNPAFAKDDLAFMKMLSK